MKFLHGNYFEFNGKPQYLVGINYLNRRWGHSSRWWDEMDMQEVGADLDAMKELGFHAFRIPLPFRLMPKAGVIDEGILKHLDAMVALAGQKGLYVVINLFMTGKTSETDWIANEKMYTDAKTIALEVQCVQAVTDRYKDNDTVIAYDVCNEPWWMFGYPPAQGGKSGREVCAEWFKKFTDGVRALEPGKPITLGIDHSGVVFNVRGDVDALADCVDVMTTHGYSRYAIGGYLLEEANSLRDTYYCSFIHRRSAIKDAPSGCMEFGNSSGYMSDAKMADHYRVLLWSLLVNGSTSFFPWVFSDFCESAKDHYPGVPHEMFFGLVRTDRSFKPHALEVAKFTKALDGINPAEFTLAKPDVAVYVPDNYYGDIDFNGQAMFNAYCLAKQAGMNVGCARRTDDWAQYKVVICHAGGIGVPEVDRLKAYVEQGGTLLISADGHNNNLFRMSDVLGVNIEEVDMITEDITLKAGANWQGLAKGGKFGFAAAGIAGRTRAIVKTAGAKCILADAAGHPGLTYHRFGKGHCLYTSFPAEFALARMPNALRKTAWWKVYAAAKALAGVKYAVEADHPSIETGVLEGQQGAIGIFINHESAAVNAKVRTSFRYAGTQDVLSGKKGGKISKMALGPNGVKVIRFY